MQKSQASIYFILFIANCFVDTINLEHCIYGSLYLVHYLNQYVCNRQGVSLFLHSSPCVNSMFPQITLAWDATAQIMPIFIRKMAHVWILLILSISQSISAVIAVFAMNQLCLSPNKVSWAFSCVHTFTHNYSYMQFHSHAFVFLSIADNAPHQFRVTALPIDGGVSVCFSSAIKDVSYMCQHDSGPKMPCRLCNTMFV